MPSLRCSAWSLLGVNLQERLIEFRRVVRHALRHLVCCPGNGLRIGVHLIRGVAPKGFQPVARRIKEVDGRASSDAVPARAQVNAYFMPRQNVRGAENRLGGVNGKGRMVKPPGPTRDNGYVMRRGPLPEPRGDGGAVGPHYHFTGTELQHLLEEAHGRGRIGGCHSRVVEPGWRNALAAIGPGGRIPRGQEIPRVVHLMIEFDRMA